MKTTATPTTLSAAQPAPTAASPASSLGAVATQSALDRAPELNAASARRFADLLRAQRSESVAPPSTAAPQSAAAPTDAAPTPETTDRNDAAGHSPETAAKASTRTAAAANPATPTAKRASAKSTVDDASDHTANEVEAKRDEPGHSALTATPPTGDRSPTLALLAGQQASSAAPRTDANDVDPHADGGAADDTKATSNSDGQGSTLAGALGARGNAVVDAADERALAAASGHTQSTGMPADATFTSALGEVLRAADPAVSRTSRSADATAAPIVPSSVAGAASEVRDVAAPATPIALATPIDSPDFAAALGVQVSVLARDGIEHAELHLHPVETGPVSIRIEVDGTNARIDFGADLAATRHAIEQGLPELASALRDAGLTLAGGGVSQHAGSRPRGDDDGSDAAARGRAPLAATSSVAAPTRAVQHRVAAGGVDLYA